MTYAEAQMLCEAEGANLASDASDTEHAFLTEFLFRTVVDTNVVWIGGNYSGSPRQLSWEDGSDPAAGFAGSLPFEMPLPNDSDPEECLVIDIRKRRQAYGMWKVKDCELRRAYLCERPLALSSLGSSTPLASSSGNPTAATTAATSTPPAATTPLVMTPPGTVSSSANATTATDATTSSFSTSTSTSTSTSSSSSTWGADFDTVEWATLDNSEYSIIDDLVQQDQAAITCGLLDGKLTSITSGRENAFLRQFAALGTFNRQLWTGGVVTAVTNTTVVIEWPNGADVDPEDFAYPWETVPTASAVGECVLFNAGRNTERDGSWTTKECSSFRGTRPPALAASLTALERFIAPTRTVPPPPPPCRLHLRALSADDVYQQQHQQLFLKLHVKLDEQQHVVQLKLELVHLLQHQLQHQLQLQLQLQHQLVKLDEQQHKPQLLHLHLHLHLHVNVLVQLHLDVHLLEHVKDANHIDVVQHLHVIVNVHQQLYQHLQLHRQPPRRWVLF